MRVLFWGTPAFALPSLRALAEEGHQVVAVVTQPDRPAGRGRALRPSPVRAEAEREGIPLLTPDRPRGEAFLDALRALDPEISVVVAYGHILRPEVLELPPRGSVNVHASLLPELRGAAPINWAVLRGFTRTGVTIMQMTPGMDEGPILRQVEVPIEDDDTASDLYVRLSEVGAAALVETLALLEAGMAEPREQDHAAATYAPKVDRETARVDWSLSARRVADLIRGMDEVPGAWSLLEGEPVKLYAPEVTAPEPGAEASRMGYPGSILAAHPRDGVVVATGEGAVCIREVQPPGKRRMKAGEWVAGRGAREGQRFV